MKIVRLKVSSKYPSTPPTLDAYEKEMDATYDGPLLPHFVGAVIQVRFDDARHESMFYDFTTSLQISHS